MTNLTLNCVMKQVFKFTLIFLLIIFSLLSVNAQQIEFVQNKNSAGKASLTSDAYYSSFTLGTANFSPELRLPVQIFYDSSVKEDGLVGLGWKIPQLESSAVPTKDGALWTAPWGEKIYFYSRKNTSRDILNLFNEKERENAYFSPYADWTANGRADSGSWTFYGRKDMRGWKFVYVDAKLRKIEAPSGQYINFTYVNGKLASVEQRGRAFISLKYNEDKSLSEILINGVSNKFVFIDGKAQILPETLAGKEEYIESKFLSKVGRDGLNPLEFSYDSAGYLTQIKRGNYVDNISVEHESLAQRKDYLKKVAAAKKAKKNVNNVAKEAVVGRILKDSTYNYSYPSNRFGNVVLTNKRGELAKYEFDSQRGIAKYTDFSGKKTTTYYFMRYDVAYNGKVRQIVDGRKRVLASYRYDKDTGKITRYRDKAKNDINFKYDSRGNLVLISKRGTDESTARPVRSFSYNKGNLKPSKVVDLDEKGEAVKTTSIQYNSEFRPVHIDDGRNTLEISYNFYGYPSKTVDSFGRETIYTYDVYNRQISRERNGIVAYAEYDKLGFPYKSYSKFEGETLSSIDVSYDKNGYPVSYIDQDGLSKTYERDELGRITKEIFPDSTEVGYEYDVIGKLSKVIDQNGHEIKFVWNKYGLDYRRTAVGQITQNVYDQYGRLSQVDSKFENGSVDRSFCYRYDDMDRLSSISYGASENEKLKYDTWGKLVEKSKNGIVSKFKYDHFGRLMEKVEGETFTKYAYDNYGKRLSRITNKGGEILDEYNTYDKFGRLVKTQSNGKTVEYIYNKKNQLSKQIIDGNSVKFEYTRLGQLAGKTLLDKDGKTLSELKYFYSKSGKLTSRLANGKLQEYKYDAKNQLLAVIDMESKNAVEEYVYDASGNILKKTVNGKTTTYTYDAANQLVSSTNPEGDITSYAYDAAGRLVKEGEKTYEYGWLDKVMRVSKEGKELARFEYHNNNQLAKAIRENDIETFEWDGLALIERSGTKYINEPHAGGGNPVFAIGGETTEAIFTDMLGTSIGYVKDGNYSEITKTSFGADTSDKLSFFTGKPYVEDLGYAFLFRNYRADMGKWLSQDLIGYPDGWNNFSYCGNSSLMIIDLFGCANRTICSRNLNTSLPYLDSMQHTWTEISLTSDEYNNLDSRYKSGDFEGKWELSANGEEYTTKLSAYEENGRLVKQTGDPRDTNPLYFHTDYDYDLNKILDILDRHSNFNNNADYDQLPYWGEKNNCNSYTNTINDGEIPEFMRTNPLYPGINYIIDNKHFE